MRYINDVSEVKKKIDDYGKRINAPKELFPDFKESRELAYPCIKIRFPYYYWIIIDHGREIERKKFLSADDLLYQIFEYITYNMASNFQVNHKVENQDFRRVMFNHQLELMGKISIEYQKKLRRHIDEI